MPGPTLVTIQSRGARSREEVGGRSWNVREVTFRALHDAHLRCCANCCNTLRYKSLRHDSVTHVSCCVCEFAARAPHPVEASLRFQTSCALDNSAHVKRAHPHLHRQHAEESQIRFFIGARRVRRVVPASQYDRIDVSSGAEALVNELAHLRAEVLRQPVAI